HDALPISDGQGGELARRSLNVATARPSSNDAISYEADYWIGGGRRHLPIGGLKSHLARHECTEAWPARVVAATTSSRTPDRRSRAAIARDARRCPVREPRSEDLARGQPPSGSAPAALHRASICRILCGCESR